MEQQVLTAYAVLLTINAAVFLLCMIQMIKFARFYRNFNRVVSNIQSYLRCVMDEDTQAQEEQRAQEEIGGGEHFSGSDAADGSGIVQLDDEIPHVEILPRRKKRASYGGQAAGGAYAAMSTEKKEEVLNSVLGELFS